MDKESILKRLNQVKQEIKETAYKARRDPEEVILVAVSKHQPLEFIKWAIDGGQEDFGENYIQEGLEKIEGLKDHNVRFHFIGRCQSNKAKYIPGNFSMVHSVDSLKFAKELDKRCKIKNLTEEILIQVNLAKEETKGGVLKEDLFKFTEEIINSTSNLKLKGLMCMPPYFENPEKVRPYFETLRNLKNSLEKKFQLNLPHLSMGMSSDFKQAILEGATLVRIGTNIFGQRKY